MSETYQELLEYWDQIANLRHVKDALRWDQLVVMPQGGAPARSAQQSTLESLEHSLLSDAELGRLLDELETEELPAKQSAVVREIRWEYDRAAPVPAELKAELAETQAEAREIWREAKENDDFESFAPMLERLLELHRKRAEYINPDKHPYEVLYEERNPHIPLEETERIFDRLRSELVPLIDAIRKSDVDPWSFPGNYDTDAQLSFNHEIADILGYPWDQGRLDTSTHPFTSGTQFDARITTRTDESTPVPSFTSTIHEFGHAMHTLGLPEDEYGTPLGEYHGHGIAESQSRFWENHVGRTKTFWELILPAFEEQFPDGDVTPQQAYEAVNQVHKDNLIRIEADELTYHMHIILRAEIERDLIDGSLSVEDLPEAWNDKMEEYLDVRPETDTEGCLQDIHWAFLGFGGFFGYTLGTLMAAQFRAAMAAEFDVGEHIRRGEFDPITDWLVEHVHRHGRRYPNDELVRRATDEDLTADYYLNYVYEKFGNLYDLDMIS